MNGCLLCLADKETATRLLVHCSFLTRIWPAVFERFGMHWVMPISISELLQQ